jgi:hypothetical protein
MEKHIHLLRILVLVALISGCATPQPQSGLVLPGLSKAEKPTDRKGPVLLEKWVSGASLPSGRYLETPPQYMDPDSNTPLPSPFFSDAIPVKPAELPPLSGESARKPLPGQKKSVPTPESPEQSVKVAVANMRLVTAVVFRMEGQKLVVVGSVPPQSVRDVSVAEGALLVATFSEEPHCVHYKVKAGSDRVLLIRRELEELAAPLVGGPCD